MGNAGGLVDKRRKNDVACAVPDKGSIEIVLNGADIGCGTLTAIHLGHAAREG